MKQEDASSKTYQTELIAKYESFRRTFNEIFINGYRKGTKLYGETGVLPFSAQVLSAQMDGLKNYLGDTVVHNEPRKTAFLSIGDARTPENPIHMLLKTHSITYEHIALHFSLLSALEDIWRDRHFSSYQYRLDPQSLQRLSEEGLTTRELYTSICRQLSRNSGQSLLISGAAVDGTPVGKDEAETLLRKELPAEQYDALYQKAVQSAQRNGSAQTLLPDHWRLIVTEELFFCYRRINGQIERMSKNQLEKYWNSAERSCTFEELLHSAASRCENRRTGPLRLPSLQVDDIMQLSGQVILIHSKKATPPIRLITLEQLRQKCHYSDFETLREILAEIWAAYCHGSAGIEHNGHHYSLSVGWSDTATPPFSQKVLTDRLPGYVENGLLLCRPDKSSYQYRLSPMRPYLYGQGLFELFPELKDAVVFFSEICPLGVLGSQLMDHADLNDRPYVFRDRYYAHTADSPLLYDLLECIRLKQVITLTNELISEYSEPTALFQPMCILSDLHQGRRYLYGYNLSKNLYTAFRLDLIRSIEPEPDAKWSQERDDEGRKLLQNSWSNRVRTGQPFPLIMELKYDHDHEFYFHERVGRERRNADVKDLDLDTIQLCANVWDPREMMPWVLSLTGRISHLRSSTAFQKRFRQHIEGMQKRYNCGHNPGSISFEAADRHFVTTPTGKEKDHTVSPLFLDFASRYIICCQHILRLFSRRRIKSAEAEEEIRKIVQTYGFVNTATPELDYERPFVGLTLPPLLEAHLLRRETLGNEEYICSNVAYTPGRPFTFWELRWLLTILEDRRMQLFMTAQEIAEAREMITAFMAGCRADLQNYNPAGDEAGEEAPETKAGEPAAKLPVYMPPQGLTTLPLYTKKTFIEQGVCHDSDAYENQNYQQHFGMLTGFICSKKAARVTYHPTKRSDSRTEILWPLKLEYSPMRDKFYLIARLPKGFYINIRLSTITSVGPVPVGDEPDPDSRGSWEDYLQENTTSDEEALEVMVSSESNAIERFLLEFSVYRKQTTQIRGTENYHVKVWYLKSDTNEMIIKLLRYGRTIEVLGPKLVRDDIARRVQKQHELLKIALPPDPPAPPSGTTES